MTWMGATATSHAGFLLQGRQPPPPPLTTFATPKKRLPTKIFGKNSIKNNRNNSLLFWKTMIYCFCPPPLNFYKERFIFTEWFHQQNKFSAPIKNMQGIMLVWIILRFLQKNTTMKAIKPNIPCLEQGSSSYFWKQFCLFSMNMPQIMNPLS